jgi:hypothetical protein
MNESRFTKGPWKAHGTQHQDWVTTEWKGKDGPDFPPTTVYICKCGRDNGFNDAALISAAPEMYDLLKEILHKNIIPDYQAMLAQRVIKVLMKARGEA